MSQKSLDAVLRCLTLLTADERKEVAARLEMLSCREMTRYAMVYSIVASVLGGVATLAPFPVFSKSRHYSRFRRGVDALENYTDLIVGRINKVVRRRVMQILVRCIVDDLRDKNLPIGAVTIGDGMCRLGEIVEQQFPGYYAAGCLRKALTGAI